MSWQVARPMINLRNELLLRFHVSPNGVLRYRKTISGSYAGRVAGSMTKDGRFVQVDGRRLAAHRIVWVLEKNEEPPARIVHLDGNRDNNAINNLAEYNDRVDPRKNYLDEIIKLEETE